MSPVFSIFGEKDETSLGWRVRNGPNGHKILDVVVSGISMAVTQRSEFRSVLSKRGMEGLIELLRVQVSKFAAWEP